MAKPRRNGRTRHQNDKARNRGAVVVSVIVGAAKKAAKALTKTYISREACVALGKHGNPVRGQNNLCAHCNKRAW